MVDRRVMVIGVDGADLRLVEHWKSHLPNLSRMIQVGSSGELESTIPSATLPSWPCFATGMNPGKLGIYGFHRRHSSGEISIHNSTTTQGLTLWDILSRHHLKSVVVNVPGTYPPHKIDGVIVSGILTPPGASFVAPPELAREIDKAAGGYVIEPIVVAPKNASGWEDGFLAEISRSIQSRVLATSYLLDHHDWTLCVVVFRAPDLVQHHFWHYMDRQHPQHSRNGLKYADSIRWCYSQVDNAIGKLLQHVDQNTYVIVMSDHGGAPMYATFLINDWLNLQGCLALKQRRQTNKKIDLAEVLRSSLASWLPPIVIARLFKLAPTSLIRWAMTSAMELRSATDLLQAIDWSRTSAYSLPGFVAGIFLNPKLTLDQRESTRNKLIERLSSVKSLGRHHVHIKAQRREDVYWGPFVREAPDIVLEATITDEAGRFLAECATRASVEDGRTWTDPWVPGGHRHQGLWIATGKAIIQKRFNLKIFDLAPTILHILGVSTQRQMDGRVAQEMFAPKGPLSERTPRLEPLERDKAEKTEVHSKEDQRRVEERLKALGYL